MSLHTEKEVKDFMIRDFVDTVRADLNCTVRFDRKAEDFVEYMKYVEFKRTPEGKIDLSGMVKDYYECEHEHFFEIKQKMEDLREERKRLERGLEAIGE